MSARPEKIGKYRILDIAGRGAMGVVYVGHDPFIDRRVAIKVNARPVEGADARKAFFNEAQAAGALDHPNILKVYDAGEASEHGDGSSPYIVIEYVEGGETLRSFADADSRLPVETVLRFIEQCALALDYAHRRGVLHKDIKPANILLAGKDQVKIGDFGIAQRSHADTAPVQGTFGSPLYMSPEQLAGYDLSAQTDIYSLGVTMFQLLAGHPPFEADSVTELVVLVSSEEPPALCTLRPDLPEAIQKVVDTAMAKELDRRYKSGAEMAAALARAHDYYARPRDDRSEAERLALARELAFFNDFSDSELEEVMELASWERYLPDESIIDAGSQEDSFYVLASGDVQVEMSGRVVGTLSAGDCIGEIGYLAQTQRSADIRAQSDVITIRIDGALADWASIPVQMRVNKAFQRTLVDRLLRTTRELAKHVG